MLNKHMALAIANSRKPDENLSTQEKALEGTRRVSLKEDEKLSVQKFLSGEINSESLKKLAEDIPKLKINADYSIGHSNQFTIDDPERGKITNNRAVIVNGRTGECYSLTFYDADVEGSKNDFRMLRVTKNTSPLAITSKDPDRTPAESAAIVTEIIKMHLKEHTEKKTSRRVKFKIRI